MTRSNPKRCGLSATIFGLAAAGFATTTPADAWMLIGSTGNRPDRVITYANASSRRDITDASVKASEIMRDHDPKTIDKRMRQLRNIQVAVVQIFVNPTAPAILRMQLTFDCGASKRYRIHEAEAITRNKLRHRSSRPDWQATPGDGWINRAHFVACDEDIWQKPASDDFEYMRAQPTDRQAERLKLPAHGIALVGDWDAAAGIGIIEFTWKTALSDGTYVPMHDRRSAAEEKIYQAQVAREEAIRAENRRAAPMVESMVAGLEGQLKGQVKGLDEEAKFQNQIADNFRRIRSKYYGTFRGLTEEQLVSLRGAPTMVSTHNGLRLLAYRRTTDNRQEINLVDGKGNLVGRDVVGQVLNCDVTFKLRVGGNNPQFRIVDLDIKVDLTSHGPAACD